MEGAKTIKRCKELRAKTIKRCKELRAKTIKRCKELTPKNEVKKIKSNSLYSVGQYKETYNFVIAILEILRILSHKNIIFGILGAPILLLPTV